MTTARSRLVRLTVVGCFALAVSGCAADAPPRDLGSGVVTPGWSSAGPASSAPPAEGAAPTPSASRAPGGTSASPTAGSPTASSAPADASVPAPVRDDDAEIEAANQSGDGRTVRIQEAQLSRAGFVAVYSGDGERLLGSAKIKPSSDDDAPITVKLDPRLTASARLLVVLHADDGNGRFDPERDPQVTGGDDDDDDGGDDSGDDSGADRLSYRVR